MKYIICLLPLLAACAKSNFTKTKDGLHYEVRLANTSTPKGRFYFIHGYGITIPIMKQAPYITISDAMHASDFDVVYIGWGEIDDVDMTNKGQDYVSKFQTWIFNLNQELNINRPVTQLFIGGASMGGAHSIWASEVLDPDVIYIHEPVTKLSVIRPFSHSDTSAADLQNRGIPHPRAFWVSCGTADYGVDWTLTRDLFSQKSEVTHYFEYPGLDHVALQPQYDDIAVWLINQIIL